MVDHTSEPKQPSVDFMLFILMVEIVAMLLYVAVVTGLPEWQHFSSGFRLAMSIPVWLLIVAMTYTCYKIDRVLYAKKD